MASAYNSVLDSVKDSAFDSVLTPGGGGPALTGFVSEWKTNNPGTSGNTQITIPTVSSGSYDCIVDWGDGNQDTITTWDDLAWTHTYSFAGNYTVTISGTFVGLRFNNGGDKSKILEISNWGPLNLGNDGAYFYGCNNLIITATDILDLTGTTNLNTAFRSCSSIVSIPTLTSWNFSSVTAMAGTFRSCPLFNQSFSGIDTGNVSSMVGMLAFSTSFDQDLSVLDVSSLTNATIMLSGVTLSIPNYDSLLTGWNSQSLQPNVFFDAGNSQYSPGAPAAARLTMVNVDEWTITDGGQTSAFVSEWKTDNPGVSANDQVTLPLESVGTYNFTVFWGDGTQDTITAWNDAATTHTYSVSGTYTITIIGAISGLRFNNGGDKDKILEVSEWGPLNLGNSSSYFYGCTNLIITATDVLDLTGMTLMAGIFRACPAITTVPSMASWDTSNITNISAFVRDSILFNQPMPTDFTSLQDASGAFFNAESFNQPFPSNTPNLANTQFMFFDADAFDQDMGSQNVTSLTNATNMFLNVTLSTPNYDSLLTGWDGQSLQSGVTFHGGNSQYSAGAPATARANMISSDSWTITDGGQVP
jgi:surface protein